MRDKLISFLKSNPTIVQLVWGVSRLVLRVWGCFVPVQNNTIIFCSFGGRKFDDSPKAIYDEICRRHEFDNWRLIWAFVEPEKYDIPRGEKLKVDTLAFFKALLYSKVWVSNSGMDRGVELHMKRTIRVETWHGTPLKKICGEEHQNSLGGGKSFKYNKKLDADAIRCAQSGYDREILARVMHAEVSSFLLCDLPRNDSLLKYTREQISAIKESLMIPKNKKVLLYMPTYREYEIYKNAKIHLPINLDKWEKMLGSDYFLLVRLHYAVSKELNIQNSDFIKDVSDYSFINDLYVIADVLLSDYSSAYFDFSILERPMLCFAYDLEEYEEKRGLYLKLDETLPCSIDYDEDSLLAHIINLDYNKASKKSHMFRCKYAPHAGNASKKIVNEILLKLQIGNNDN